MDVQLCHDNPVYNEVVRYLLDVKEKNNGFLPYGSFAQAARYAPSNGKWLGENQPKRIWVQYQQNPAAFFAPTQHSTASQTAQGASSICSRKQVSPVPNSFDSSPDIGSSTCLVSSSKRRVSSMRMDVNACSGRSNKSSMLEAETCEISMDDVVIIFGENTPTILSEPACATGDAMDDTATVPSRKRQRHEESNKLPISPGASRVIADQQTRLDCDVERALCDYESLRTECTNLAGRCRELKSDHQRVVGSLRRLMDSHAQSDSTEAEQTGDSPSSRNEQELPARLVAPSLNRADTRFLDQQKAFAELFRTKKMDELRATKARLQATVERRQRIMSELRDEYDAWVAQYQACLNRLKRIKNRKMD